MFQVLVISKDMNISQMGNWYLTRNMKIDGMRRKKVGCRTGISIKAALGKIV